MKINKLNTDAGKKCKCDLCKMRRRFERIVSKLPPKDAGFLDGLLNAFLDQGQQLNQLEDYVEALGREN